MVDGERNKCRALESGSPQWNQLACMAGIVTDISKDRGNLMVFISPLRSWKRPEPAFLICGGCISKSDIASFTLVHSRLRHVFTKTQTTLDREPLKYGMRANEMVRHTRNSPWLTYIVRVGSAINGLLAYLRLTGRGRMVHERIDTGQYVIIFCL
jgi:hypothetical protein